MGDAYFTTQRQLFSQKSINKTSKTTYRHDCLEHHQENTSKPFYNGVTDLKKPLTNNIFKFSFFHQCTQKFEQFYFTETWKLVQNILSLWLELEGVDVLIQLYRDVIILK